MGTTSRPRWRWGGSGRRRASFGATLAAAGLLSWLARPGPADACGPCLCPFGDRGPAGFAGEIAVDGALVVVSPDGAAPAVELRDAAGAAIAVETERLEGTAAFLVSPERTGPAGDVLSLTVTASDQAPRTNAVQVVDAGAPRLGAVMAATPYAPGVCAPGHAATVAADDAEALAPVLLATVTQDGVSTTGLAQLVPTGGAAAWVDLLHAPSPTDCFGPLAFDDAAFDPARPVQVALRGVGLDGTLTAPAATTATFEALPAGGCPGDDGGLSCAVERSPGGAAPTALALAALSVLARCRRRRSPHENGVARCSHTASGRLDAASRSRRTSPRSALAQAPRRGAAAR